MSLVGIVVLSLIGGTPQSQGEGPDPNKLSIGRSGVSKVTPGQLFDLRSNKAADLGDFVHAAKGARFVYLGENHATTAHQAEEAAIVSALSKDGRRVTVGVEMFQRPKQDVLDKWSAGALGESEFLAASEWKTQWGFDYGFYRPVFEVVRENQLPLVALNVPRDWVRAVGRGGYDALPTSAKLQLPPQLFLGNRDHRQVFDAMMGGHSMTGTSMDKMYAAQVLWDEGMADTALKYVAISPPDKAAVFVVIAGAGHVMYGQGINYRVGRRKGGKGITLVMIQSDGPAEVSRGLADFVYVSPKATD